MILHWLPYVPGHVPPLGSHLPGHGQYQVAYPGSNLSIFSSGKAQYFSVLWSQAIRLDDHLYKKQSPNDKNSQINTSIAPLAQSGRVDLAVTTTIRVENQLA